MRVDNANIQDAIDADCDIVLGDGLLRVDSNRQLFQAVRVSDALYQWYSEAQAWGHDAVEPASAV